MARRGENIRKRKDGRWEGRYIKARTSEGKVQWGYVYGTVYAEVKQVLIRKKADCPFVRTSMCPSQSTSSSSCTPSNPLNCFLRFFQPNRCLRAPA